MTGLWRDRDYLSYALGNLVSNLGTWAQRIGIGWLSWDLTHKSSWVGTIALVQLAPLILLGPPFGALFDRHNHRRYAISVNIAMASIAGLLYLLTASGRMNIGILCVMAALAGIVNSAFQSARLAIVNDVVPPELLSQAITVNSVLFNVSRAAGPALASLILAKLGLAALFAANALSFAGIIFALFSLKVRPKAPKHGTALGLLAESREGIRYLLREPQLGELVLLSGITATFARGIFEMLPAFADAVFQKGSVGLANLTTAAGLGAICGALLLSRAGTEARLRNLTRLSTLLAGLGVAAFGLTTGFKTGLALIALASFLLVMCGVGLQVMLQKRLDDSYRGRILGLWTAVAVAGPGVGSFLIGGLAEVFGLRFAAIASGIASTLLVAWAMRRSTVLRPEH